MTQPDPDNINRLCAKCLRPCKQPLTVLLLECPRYLTPPFKIEKNKYDQLGLFGEEEED